MRFIKNYSQYRIFKDFFIKPDTKKASTENAFVLLSENETQSVNLINSQFVQNNIARAYYIDKDFDHSIFRNREILNRAEYYKDLKSKTEIIKAVNVVGTLKQENVYVDTHRAMSEILGAQYINTKSVRTNAFATYLQKQITNLDNLKYKNIYITMSAGLAMKELQPSNLATGTSILSLLNIYIREQQSNKASIFNANANVYFVVFDTQSSMGFWIDLKDKNLNLNKISSAIKTFYKVMKSEQLGPEDMALIGDDSVTSDFSKLSDPRDFIRSTDFWSASNTDVLAVDTDDKLYDSAELAFVDFMIKSGNSFDKLTNILYINDIAPWKSLSQIKLYTLEDKQNVVLNNEGFASVTNPTSLKPSGKLSLESVDETSVLVKFGDNKFKVMVMTDRIKFNNKILEQTKENVMKILKVDPKVVPLSGEEIALIDSIVNNVDEYIQKDISTMDEVLKYIKTDDSVSKAIQKLIEYRFSSLESVRNREKIKALKDREDSAVIVDDEGHEELLAEKIKKLRDGLFPAKVFPVEGRIADEMKKSTTIGFREAYLNEQYETDIFKIFTSFSNSDDIPIFIDSVKKTDISSQRDKKILYEIRYSMPNGKPQTMRVEIPKISSEGYMFLNGARKAISNQIIPLPIIKIMSNGIDAVQYTTNYNKIFVERTKGPLNSRVGNVVSSFLSNSDLLRGPKYEVLMGAAYTSNTGMVSSIEFDELAKNVVHVKSDNTVVHFIRSKGKEVVEKIVGDITSLNNSINMQNYFPIGKMGTRILLSDVYGAIYSATAQGEGLKEESSTTSEFIKKILKDVAAPIASKIKNNMQSKKFVYSTVKVANLKLPLIGFLGYKEGVEKVLEAYNVKYEFSKDPMQLPLDTELNEMIKFQDGILYFNGNNVSHQILVNGLRALDTESYDFQAYGPKGDAYSYWFMDQGKPQHGKALGNFYVLFIDHITKEVLDSLDIPSDIMGSFLYCNTLLNNPSYSNKYDISQYRVRGHEFIAANLYSILGRNIENFRRLGQSSGSTASLSIRQDELIRTILESPLCADATLLNPIKQCMDLSTTTLKGKGGYPFNSSKGTEDFRVFDESMKGILGMVTPDNAQVGVTRKLSLNSAIRNKRGIFADMPDSQLQATNLLSIGELCSTFTAQSADGPRVGMQTTQSGHQLPTNDMQRCLVTSGAQKIIPFFAGNEFAFKATEDGVIEQIDHQNELVLLKYADGTNGVIDYSIKNVRAPDGFYTGIELEGDFTIGKKFKKGDILAADKRFFYVNGNNSELKHGTLTRIAIACHDTTYEDSSVITERLSNRLASTIIMQKAVTIGPRTNIQSMMNVGDEVETGQALMVFEEAFGDEDGSLAELLGRLGDEFNEEISDIGKNAAQSSYTGEIVDVRIHYNRPLEEYSDSCKKVITDYIKRYEKRAEILKNVRDDQIVDYRSTERNETGKGGGQLFDGLVVEFYIRTTDSFKIGDKLVFQKALKQITAEIIPEEDAYGRCIVPYGVKDGQEIHAFLSPMSLVSRMTCDVYRELAANTVLVDFKKMIASVLNEECNIAGTRFDKDGGQIFPSTNRDFTKK